MKILLIGANGQLGSDIVKNYRSEDVIALTHNEIDVTDAALCNDVFSKYRPEVVINTAAFHAVDKCEDDIGKSFAVNAFALKHLSLLCNKIGSVLVQFSTDYIFDGKKGTAYVESDLPFPLNVYGLSKLAGEQIVKCYCDKFFIIRTSGLYGVAGSSGKGGNFVETMIKLAHSGNEIKVVNDQFLSPTYTFELARKVRELINTNKFGTYHITGSGECSWFEFAQKIFEYTGLSPKLVPVTSQEFGARVVRPRYSVLDNKNLKNAGLNCLPHWSESLLKYLEENGHKRL